MKIQFQTDYKQVPLIIIVVALITTYSLYLVNHTMENSLWIL